MLLILLLSGGCRVKKEISRETTVEVWYLRNGKPEKVTQADKDNIMLPQVTDMELVQTESNGN